MRLRTTLISATIISIVLLGSGIKSGAWAMVNYSPLEEIIGDSDEQREEFHQTYPLAATGRVSVENLNGEVKIKVWDRDAVQVDAVKRAYQRERLNEAKIDISTSPESVRIRTLYPDGDQSFTDDEKGRSNNPAIVDYTLTVPRKARLESIELVNGSLELDGTEGAVKASTVNGSVMANGLAGETKLDTVNGNLEATFTQLTESMSVSLGSVNGNLVIVIPSDSNAQVKAGTVHGSISNEFGLDVQHGEYVGHELFGQLGTGGPRIKLSNVNGGITLKHAQDGRKLSKAVCLLSDKEKDKEKIKAERDQMRDDAAVSAEARRAAREAREQAAREMGQNQAEIQREVEKAIREAQREIQRAQVEIQRETERQVREQMRMENRGFGRGSGTGKGRGEGRGDAQLLDRETKSFAVTGVPTVNVGTFDGAVTVHGWDKAEVTYTATKRASDEDQLKQISVQSEQQGSAISVIARSTEGSGSASLDVYVPRNSSLHVSSDDGHLNVQGVSGGISLRTGDGAIEVNDAKGQLQVNTGDGHIRIANFDGDVDARTGDGAITLEGKFSVLSARTGDGSITLAVPRDSNFTIETNAEEISNEGVSVSEDIAPSPRLKRWRVGQGGDVFILNTGDGRIILRLQ